MRVPIILPRRILQRTLTLLLPCGSIIRQPALNTLPPDTAQTLRVGGGFAQRVVALGEVTRGLAAGADVDDGGVRGLEVGGAWRVFREGEVGFALFDDLGFVFFAGAAVDDGLKGR